VSPLRRCRLTQVPGTCSVALEQSIVSPATVLAAFWWDSKCLAHHYRRCPLKTYRNLYPQVVAWENLELAYRRARKGKRARRPAAFNQAPSPLSRGRPMRRLLQALISGRPMQHLLQPPSRGRPMQPQPVGGVP
jgi:hypothetical protein